MGIEKTFFALAFTVLVFWILWLGQNLLVPFVLAVFLFYLINTLADTIRLIPLGPLKIHRFIAILVALSIILVFASFLVSILTENINAVIAKAPEYQRNFDQISARIAQSLRLEDEPTFQDIFGQVNLRSMLGNLAAAVAGIAGSTGFILVYLIFLFLEQTTFRPKIRALFPTQRRQAAIHSAITEIRRPIQRYLGIKTATSAATGVCSYLILIWVGIDFAGFWAVLIFVFNYIPTIGSIVATLFPALLALFQFPDQYGPFFAVLLGVGALQLLIGNYIEPRIMGTGLGLSPLIIILSLTLWGSLWGIVGAILAVPITVIVTIILSKFETTRPIAVLLSKDGSLGQSPNPVDASTGISVSP